MKNKITSILYDLILFLVRIYPTKKKTTNHLLLIKNDEIGDYILFRNFLKDIRTSEKYRNKKITLLGNTIWKQLFDEFDIKLVDNVIWMNKTKFKKSLSYRFNFLLQIRREGFDEVVNCIYSRNILTDSCFVSVVTCDKKIGFANDVWRSYTKVRNTNRLYTNLIKVDEKIQFELFRNREFISRLIDNKETELHTSVFIESVNSTSSEKKYCVIFAGAGKQDKLWPPKYFAEVIDYIDKNYKLTIYLCGGPGDVKDSNAVKELTKIPSKDYTGRTTMVESLSILKDAEFMLSVDTGSVHMGAAVHCPVIALYSGRDYGRFAPYPKEIFDRFYSVFSDSVDILVKNNHLKLSDPNIFSFNEIRNIPPGKVTPYIDLLIK